MRSTLFQQKQNALWFTMTTLCSKHSVNYTGSSSFIKCFHKMKTSDKFWFYCRVSLLHVFHKPEDIHINTDMVEQQNIWKWHGWKATTRQTFNSLVCGPLKTSDLGWIIVANYFNYILTPLPQRRRVNCILRPSRTHTTQRGSVTELTQVSKTYSAFFSLRFTLL